MNTHERRALAIRASQSISRAFGIPDGVPKVLKDTNNTIVHLWPSPIVAKVSTRELFRHRSSSLESFCPNLPSFRLQLSEAEELLNNSAAVPQLSENDRLFLRNVSRETIQAIGSVELETRPLHGECSPQQMIATGWTQPDRAPEVREAAECHLMNLKRSKA